MKIAALSTITLALLTGCGGKDFGTRMSDLGAMVPAEEQQVGNFNILIDPRLEDLTDESFNIRYIEASIGTGIPKAVVELAISTCADMGKKAFFRGTSRGMIQAYSVKAYYTCATP